MNEKPDLKTWNQFVLAMMQALLGAISANFRRIVLDHDGIKWHLLFILENDDENDREEIDDIIAEFEALLEHGIDLEVKVKISSEFITWPEPPARVIFQRRE